MVPITNRKIALSSLSVIVSISLSGLLTDSHVLLPTGVGLGLSVVAIGLFAREAFVGRMMRQEA